MNKLLPLAAFALVLGVLVTPKIIGSQVNTKLNEIITSINASQGYKLDITELKSGWFSTQAKLSLSLDPEVMGNLQEIQSDPWVVDLDFDASHGPILLGDTTELGLVNWQVDLAANSLRDTLSWPENTALYQMKAKLDLSSKLEYKDRIIPFTSIAGEMNQFDFSGYQGGGTYKEAVFSYQGEAERFTVKTDDGELEVTKLTVDTKIESSLENLFDAIFYDSNGKLNIASIVLNEQSSGERLDVNDLYVTSQTQLDKTTGALDLVLVYGVKSIEMDDFVGEDFALGLEINNLSQAFFGAYQSFVPSLASADSEQSSALVMDFLKENLLSLVVAEPEIKVTSLRGTIAQGSFESHLNASLVGINTMPANIDDTAFWLSHTLFDGKIKGDKAVIELAAKFFMLNQLKNNPQTQGMSLTQLEEIADSQVPMLLQTIVYQGLIISDENSYSTKLSFKDSVFKVNELVVPLPF